MKINDELIRQTLKKENTQSFIVVIGSDIKDILRLLTELPNTIIVADEAYIEFTEEESFISKINNHSNLIVLRTLSKFYAMAGISIGFTITNTASP